METSQPALRRKYALFIASIALIIIATQVIIQFDLKQQNLDARLINMAGRQRMLSQRIVKIALYIYYDFKSNDGFQVNYRDSLVNLSGEFERTHYHLIQQNKLNQKSDAIERQLNANTAYLKMIVEGAHQIVATNDKTLIRKSLLEITRVEILFLLTMDKTVSRYQFEAEHKLASRKFIEITLSILAILILILEFIYIFLPALARVGSTNQKLFNLNRQLVQSNLSLAASEEEIRTNLEQINTLKSNLETREKQYRDLVEDASDIIYELDNEGRFSFVNSTMKRLSGYDTHEILGANYYELIFEEDQERVFKFYQQQRKNLQEVSYLEFRMVTRAGELLWIGQNVKMFFEDNYVVKVSAVARDITQLNVMRDRLADQERLYRLLSENSSDVVTISDNEREFKFVSQSCKEVMGYTPQEMLGRKISEFVHPDDLNHLNFSANKVRQGGESIERIEFRVLHKQGHYVWVEAHAKPFHDMQSNEAFVQSSFRDISVRKQTEAKMEESERLYRLVSENSRDVISLHKLDGTFEYISPSCIDLHGYSPNEMIGKIGTDFIHPDDIPGIEQKAVATLHMMEAELPVEPMQFRIMSKHHGAIWAENMIKPIFVNGVLTGFQSTVRDISVRKKDEEALKVAKEKAEYATKAKSQFLGMMSHEIRTPMNAIIGLTNLLLQNETHTERLEKLKLLKFSGENLLTIINDILDFTKIEADKIEIESLSFHLNHVVSRIVKMMEYRCTDKGIKLIYEHDVKLPPYLIGDPVRIGQIVTNLIGNAIKFTQHGEVKISISELSRQNDEVEIQVEVIDSGIGIAPDKLETIFESFSQAESTTTRKYGGTGLGLAITRKLIQKMEGEIYVESKEDVGSRFYFKLRLKEGKKGVEPESENETTISVFKANVVNVLLAEDNALNQLVASEFLKQWGATVAIANNGREAVQMIKSKTFDIVLMDLQMPEMNGYEATKAIRSMDEQYFKSVPVIALTASAMIDMRDKVIATGMTDFLTKPFQPLELYRMVHKYLREEKRSDLPKEKPTLSESMDQITKGNKTVALKLLKYAVENLNELLDGFEKTKAVGDPEIFDAVVHKCKMTISFLKDDALNEIVKKSKEGFRQMNQIPLPDDLAPQLYKVINLIIKKLNDEIDNLTEHVSTP